MRPPPADHLRRYSHRLVPAALLALAPKCLLCLLGYAGLGTAWGLGGPELCGAGETPPLAWPTALSGLGALAGAWMLLRPRRSA